jgi:hypothetical protein
VGFVRYADRQSRDAEILRLRSTGLSLRKIAALVGCGTDVVHGVVNPEARAAYDARRREHNTSPEGLERQREYRARKSA